MHSLAYVLLCLAVTGVLSKSIQRPICGAICDLYCQYGNALDAKGCPLCRCKKTACDDELAPLAGYFCGRGTNRRDCPSTHFCNIAANDAYAVCCPKTAPLARLEKPGSCPKPSGMIGICIARCNDDSSCPGNQKCCGGCPRECVKPVL